MKLIARNGIFIILMLVLTACANGSEGTIANKDQSIDKHIAAVEEAIEKASELDNGKYFVNLYGQGNDKTSLEEGTFIVHNNQVDWQMKYLNGADLEVIQKGGVQYQLFPGETEWKKVEGQTFISYITSLMELEIKEEDIASVNVTKENGLSIYEVTYNDSYLDSLSEDLVIESKENLENAKKENDEDRIKYWETNLEYHESFNYLESSMTLSINEDGVLVRYLHDTTAESMNLSSNKIETTTLKIEIEITDYNLENIVIEL